MSANKPMNANEFIRIVWPEKFDRLDAKAPLWQANGPWQSLLVSTFTTVPKPKLDEAECAAEAKCLIDAAIEAVYNQKETR